MFTLRFFFFFSLEISSETADGVVQVAMAVPGALRFKKNAALSRDIPRVAIICTSVLCVCVCGGDFFKFNCYIQQSTKKYG